MFSLFKKIYRMAGTDKKKINIAIILQMFDTTLSFVPLGTALLFYENYINNTLTEHFYLMAFAILLLGVVFRTFVRYYMDKSSMSTIYRIFYSERIKVADHLKRINMGFFTDDNIGKVTTTMVNGMSFIEEQCMNSLITVFTSVINILIITIMISVLNVTYGVIFVVVTIVVALVLIPYNKLFVKYATKHNNANVVLTGAIIEYVKNISVIKAFHLLGKHKRSNDAFTYRKKTDLYGEALNIPFIVGSMCIMSVGVGAMIYVSVTQTDITALYNIIILIILALYIFRSLETIVLKLGILNIANDSLNEVESLYNEKELCINGDKKPSSYELEFKNVEFAYEDKKVIDNISFQLKENTLNALVGLSGSGKSTLVNLIPRFYEIQKGTITIGGVDIREMSQETLYSCISMVFQNVYLFEDTVYNNIAFGNDNATKEDVINACKKARCYDFIMELPDGFDTVLGEAGLSLSGGERQRISIARAILKDAPIILLDEATASVDPDNETEIQEAINALIANKTILVIAHKLSCVKNAAKILVINEGKLVQEGTHQELMNCDGLYASLWKKRTNSKSWKIVNN